MFDMQFAEVVMSDDRPRRDRASECNEQARKARFDAGKCRDCERRRPADSALCKWCRRRLERATNRYRGTERKGRMSIDDMDQADITQAMRSLCAAAAGLEAVKNHPTLNRRERERHKAEPLAQVGLTVRWLVQVAKRNGTLAELLDAVKLNLDDE
jgi:hypothetical protein